MDDSLVASGSRHHSGTGWLPGLPLVFGQARKIISLYHNTSDLQPKFKSEKNLNSNFEAKRGQPDRTQEVLKNEGLLLHFFFGSAKFANNLI